MEREYSDFHRKAIEKLKRLWRLYIINESPEELEKAFQALPDNFMMIGTGRHEFYKTLEAFLSGITADQVEARTIQFELQDEWYDVQAITDDVCMVYGSVWVREAFTPGKEALVDMEGSRFTAVCRAVGENVKICSIHHSMPYVDQGEDEYYPKSLASLANEALRKSRALERRVEMDHLTELYNRVYMERHVAQAMKEETGYFIEMDLDGFKNVNDTIGHLAGDRVLREFSALLRSVSPASAFVGRMGGDEFAVWDSVIRSRGEVEERFSAIQKGCRELSDKLGAPISYSAGIAFYDGKDEDFTALYQRADRALYQAKTMGKGQFCWAE